MNDTDEDMVTLVEKFIRQPDGTYRREVWTLDGELLWDNGVVRLVDLEE